MKKLSLKTCLFLALISGCLIFNGCGNDEPKKDEVKEEEESKEELVHFHYEIISDNPSQDDIDITISKLIKKGEQYSKECSAEVNSDMIDVKIKLSSDGEYDYGDILKELGVKGELLFLDEENYDKWSQGEDFEAGLTGAYISSAEPVQYSDDTTDSDLYAVSIVFTDEGKEIFADLTENNIDKIIYIIYNGEVLNSPRVMNPITEGSVLITGLESFEEAVSLSDNIEIGELPLRLKAVNWSTDNVE